MLEYYLPMASWLKDNTMTDLRQLERISIMTQSPDSNSYMLEVRCLKWSYTKRGIVVTMQTILFDQQQTDWSTHDKYIWDIKEQDVLFIAQRNINDERLQAYIDGWQDAVAIRIECDPSRETLMPQDLVAPNVLRLKTPVTSDDFCNALLTKGRVGL
jgi:hypothetical protein